MIISRASLLRFWPLVVVFLRAIAGLTTVIGRTFLGLIGTRAVLAGVPETHIKKSLLGLSATLAVGLFIFAIFARKENASHHSRFDHS